MEDVVEYLKSKDPFEILKAWLKTAQAHPSIKEPAAMVLSTVDHQGCPDSRVVLVKEITKTDLVFYTNIKSPKGQQLAQKAYCSLLFYWDPLFQQVRLKGRVQRVSREKTLEYWKTRPKQSQISQWVSQQSMPLNSRSTLSAQIKEAEQQFMNQLVPCPENWCGYSVFIQGVEFWQGRDHRRHDRFVFERKEDQTWNIQRIYP